MTNLLAVWSIVLVIDLVVSFSYTLWPRRGRTSHPASFQRGRRRPAAVQLDEQHSFN